MCIGVIMKVMCREPEKRRDFRAFFSHFCVMDEFLANGCEMRCKQHEDVIYISIRGRHMLSCT